MKTCSILSALLISAAVLAGCSKPEPASTPTKAPATQVTTPAPTAPAPEAAPPPPPSGAASAPAPAQAAAPTEEKIPAEQMILHAVQSFMISKERPPKDINELVQAGFLKSVPPAPPGKKIVYDAGSASVKLVNQ